MAESWQFIVSTRGLKDCHRCGDNLATSDGAYIRRWSVTNPERPIVEYWCADCYATTICRACGQSKAADECQCADCTRFEASKQEDTASDDDPYQLTDTAIGRLIIETARKAGARTALAPRTAGAVRSDARKRDTYRPDWNARDTPLSPSTYLAMPATFSGVY